MKDSIVMDLRKIRDEHAAQFSFDIEAIARDLQKKERTAGHKLVSLKPRKLAKR